MRSQYIYAPAEVDIDITVTDHVAITLRDVDTPGISVLLVLDADEARKLRDRLNEGIK